MFCEIAEAAIGKRGMIASFNYADLAWGLSLGIDWVFLT